MFCYFIHTQVDSLPFIVDIVKFKEKQINSITKQLNEVLKRSEKLIDNLYLYQNKYKIKIL